MPRQARLDVPGTLHHVIVRGIEREQIVKDRLDRNNFVKRMGKLADETRTGIYAWALMANHGHILLKSGPAGLSHYMRRLLTGYVITYNKRHVRYGHLFQNRYKSVVCDEDLYFLELVRYIHLNPFRAKIVNNMSELDRYAWSGHSVIMGRRKHAWQDDEEVLGYFGKRKGPARQAYRQFVADGIEDGKREDLTGGGLIRTAGGWSQVISQRKNQEKILTDERILGSNEFVEQILKETDDLLKSQLSIKEKRLEARRHIAECCKKEGIGIEAIKGGSRRGIIPQVRARLAIQLVENYGLSLAETGRQLGVTTSGVCRILSRASLKK